MSGLKHLIQCHCVLPQYRRMKDPVFHQFVVYSKFNKDNVLKPKVSKCNNCGVFHNIVDFCKSEILHDYEGDGFLITIDDISRCVVVENNAFLSINQLSQIIYFVLFYTEGHEY